MIISLKAESNRLPSLANRLFCAARMELAANPNVGIGRAVEMLETAPDQRLLTDHFNPVYQMLVPLYLGHDIFESSLEYSDFNRKSLETFETAFRRFNEIISSPDNHRVDFYLGVIALAFNREDEARDCFARAEKIGAIWGAGVSAIVSAMDDGETDQVRQLLGRNYELVELAASRVETKSPAVEEFERYCLLDKGDKAVGRKRNRLFWDWLKGSMAPPEQTFTFPVRAAFIGSSSFCAFLKVDGRWVSFSVEAEPGEPIAIQMRDKCGRKIFNVFDASGEVFIAKHQVTLPENGKLSLHSLSPSYSELANQRGILIRRWLKGEVSLSDEWFNFAVEHSRAITLFCEGYKLQLTGVPFIMFDRNQIKGKERYFSRDKNDPDKYHFRWSVAHSQVLAAKDAVLEDLWSRSHQVVVRFIDREGIKIAQVYSNQDLLAPIAEFEIKEIQSGHYKSFRIDLSKTQTAWHRNQLVVNWLKAGSVDPAEPLTYDVLSNGCLNLATLGGRQVVVASLSEYVLGRSFESAEVAGLTEWFELAPGEQYKYLFKSGTENTEIVKTHNPSLIDLWEKASQVQVQLKTEGEDKQLVISQVGNPRLGRRFKLVIGADLTGKAVPIDSNPFQNLVQRIAPIKTYLLENGPLPTDPILMPLRRNASLDLLLAGGQRVTLQGLIACSYFDSERLLGMDSKYLKMFAIKGALAKFTRFYGVREIVKIGDPALLALWEGINQAQVVFREDQTSDGKTKRIVEIRHASTQAIVAEFELSRTTEGKIIATRIELSPMQSAMQRNKIFYDWVVGSGPVPEGVYEYIPEKGEVPLFRLKGTKKAMLPLGKYTFNPRSVAVSARHNGQEKIVVVKYEDSGMSFIREYRISYNQKSGITAKETETSLARIIALPKPIRGNYLREDRRHAPERLLPQNAITALTSKILDRLMGSAPKGFDLPCFQVSKDSGISATVISRLWAGEVQSTRADLQRLRRLLEKYESKTR